MFEKCIDLGDILLGTLLAILILYLFYLWIKAGAERWEIWDRLPRMTPEQKNEQTRRLRYLMTGPKWLTDTYPYALFWAKYYDTYYDLNLGV